MGFKITNKGLYWWLIGTFTLLYGLVAFVSTLHAIDFFRLANVGALAILLGIAYEVGQATVLFSILMTKNKEKFLPWVLMVLLTALQVTANVYASFKHMSLEGNNDWEYWYTSILKIFGVLGGTPETYMVIISWISGALLPIVALGMTALVAQNIKMMTEGEESTDDESIDASDLIAAVSKVNPTEEDLLQAEDILSKLKPVERPTDNKDVENEVDKIKKIMKSPPKVSDVITKEVKEKIAPGLGDDEDQFGPVDLPNEEPDLITPGTLIPDDIPINKVGNDGLPEEHEVVPELDAEEVKQMFPDEEEEEVMTLKINNGLLDIEPSPPVEEPKVEEPKPSPPPEESEEERLERLRNVARENLKKK